VGDGGFQMAIPELGTIATHGLPIKIVIMNNGYLGMVRQWQTLFYNNRLSSVQLDCFPDAAKLAGAYGFKGKTIDKPWELAPALKQMNQLINVLQATDLTDLPAVVRELVLVRVRTTQENRTAVLKEAEIFAGRVVDSSTEGYAIEVTGEPEKLNAFVDVMRSYGELDVTRSGSLAIGLESKRLKLQPPVPTRAGSKVEESTVY